MHVALDKSIAQRIDGLNLHTIAFVGHDQILIGCGFNFEIGGIDAIVPPAFAFDAVIQFTKYGRYAGHGAFVLDWKQR